MSPVRGAQNVKTVAKTRWKPSLLDPGGAKEKKKKKNTARVQPKGYKRRPFWDSEDSGYHRSDRESQHGQSPSNSRREKKTFREGGHCTVCRENHTGSKDEPYGSKIAQESSKKRNQSEGGEEQAKTNQIVEKGK